MSVTPSQFDLLAKMVDVANLRHKVLAQNVANVNTPGYRRLNVQFDEALANQLAKHGPRGLENATPEIIEDDVSPSRLDGNNVAIDSEMMRINKNTLLNNTYLQILATKMAMMRRATENR
ncbi:MAG: flagellar basal body rod protein FlgB [Planctomycetales bacterium]|nr:flagellar basal body rod protein FlgB [Planctomycetales bacterium]